MRKKMRKNNYEKGKENIMKKIAALLCTAVVFTAFPAEVMAAEDSTTNEASVIEEETTQNTDIAEENTTEMEVISEEKAADIVVDEAGFKWNGTVIVGYQGDAFDIVIPAKATAIGDNAFKNNDNITSVRFEQGSKVQSLRYQAFYDCDSLNSVELPTGLITIGQSAFASCGELTSVVIPDTVTVLGTGAFEYCTSLKEITIPKSVTCIGAFCFRGNPSLTTFRCESTYNLFLNYDYAFYDSNAVTIYGYVGSPAEKFAKSHKLPFVPLLDSVGIYIWQYENGLIEGGAVVNEGANAAPLLYRWLVYDVKNGQWIQASDWSSDYGIHYRPTTSGDYLVYCEVKDGAGKTFNATVGVNYRHAIKAICQMPDPNGNGYLIGIQSFNNPGYYYEMQILDCNLYMQGKDAWIYSTGKCGTQDTTLWTTWKPVPGYYWTLFNLYDASGNLVDQQCYGFTNAE
ncbi:leucine-rich repeat domain-containing protein [Roseburia sp. 499]|uniref:leucine-rich repeat domain-containing protein n=1 Tax=Roseburia sp. 499 TaxID=1261634 RepID=UPI0009533489|nr:leucine-rich repeat domain-containing protein [Roseburia sp. 499]WVK69433.1 leucine-rich repeat domain-containing protein [Roseburia sp. 499]